MSDSLNTSILIFGASGDLTSRKLMPALFHLCQQKYVAADVPIIGVARREKTDEQFRSEVLDAIRNRIPADRFDDATWQQFSSQLFYRQVDISDSTSYGSLRTSVEQVENELWARSGHTGPRDEQPRHRVVYLATTPSLFAPSVEGLHEAGMIPDRLSASNLRVVVEKPFGHDLASAQELTDQLARRLRENQIYRIDHYLGKETVQNILLFRFGNAIFEPLLNRSHVDHIQITVAESQGMEGSRGGYYDTSGALRDVLQNHVLQLLCLIAMDPPSLFQAREIRDEKMKVLQALRRV